MLAVFFIATCGLIYELLCATAATYLLGDSVTQFSLVIGAYLFAMGLGSYASRYIEGDLVGWFVRLEVLVGLLGGVSALLLFVTFSRDGAFSLVLYLLVGGIGIGVGLEIPLLIRILEDRMKLKDLVARVLFFDYLGALLASVAFPLLLVPKLGLIKTGLLIGMLNAAVGLWVIGVLGDRLRHPRRNAVEALVAVIILATGLFYGESLTQFVEDDLFPDEIVFAESSRYQRIVVTRSTAGEIRLFLNNHLQFSSTDEYRYHEALVHPAMATAPAGPIRALVLGGGDGMAVRELLRYRDVQTVTLVDLDPAMTRLFKDKPMFRALNAEALNDPRVTVVNDDAMAWLERSGTDRFDVLIVDFPDPSSYAVGKLYTRTFYAWARARMTARGVMAIQSTSPMAARRSFWCIDATVRSVGLHTAPYHALVPSFGEWGYVLASPQPIGTPRELRAEVAGLRFLNGPTMAGMFNFPADMERPLSSPINRLNEPELVRLYDEEWAALGL